MMTNEEKLIKFLLTKLQTSKNNIVYVYESDLDIIGLTERETVQAIYLLKDEGLLDILKKSVHDDFSMFWQLSLKSACVHYFDNQKVKAVSNRRSWFNTYVPSTLSVIAIIISIIALLKP